MQMPYDVHICVRSTLLVLLGWAVVGLRLRDELHIRLSRTFFVYIRVRGSAEPCVPAMGILNIIYISGGGHPNPKILTIA